MKLFGKSLFIFISFISFFSSINAQIINSIEFNCSFENITTNGNNISELNDDTLDELISLNFNKILNNSLLTLFGKKYQIFLFRISNCTDIFLSNDKLKEKKFNNSLHLFSIEGNIESNPDIIKLAIQTKK